MIFLAYPDSYHEDQPDGVRIGPGRPDRLVWQSKILREPAPLDDLVSVPSAQDSTRRAIPIG